MHVFLDKAYIRDLGPAALEVIGGFFNQPLRHRGARGDSDALDALEPFGIDPMEMVDQLGGNPTGAGDAAELIGVLAVGRADNKHEIDLARQLLYRILAILSGIADVLFGRGDHAGKSLAQNPNNLFRVIDAQGGLGENSHALGIGNLDPLRLLDIGDDSDSPRSLAVGADYLIVLGMANEDNPVSLGGKAAHLPVHLLHHGAGGVDDDLELSLFALLPNHGGDPVGAEDQFRAGRHFLDGLDKGDSPAHEQIGRA